MLRPEAPQEAVLAVRTAVGGTAKLNHESFAATYRHACAFSPTQHIAETIFNEV